MLGKTHVVNALTVAHVGLVFYIDHLDKQSVTLASNKFLGLESEVALLVEYSAIALSVIFLALFLFRVGKPSEQLTYIVMIASLLGIMYYTPENTGTLRVTLTLFAFTIGALLPDIDSQESTLGRYIKPLNKLVPHRTYTHTIWAIGLLYALSVYFDSIYLLAMTLGFFIHIVQDSFSLSGINWLYPFSFSHKYNKKYTIIPVRYRTGDKGERIIYYSSLVFHALCATYVLYRLFA